RTSKQVPEVPAAAEAQPTQAEVTVAPPGATASNSATLATQTAPPIDKAEQAVFDVPLVEKRRPGRPPGSKNKKTAGPLPAILEISSANTKVAPKGSILEELSTQVNDP